MNSNLLSIVIPALNEEEAIGSTIERCLAARDHIVESSFVDAVEVIVVSDGSTDRTEEIARSFDEVSVLTFVENRGYGAAIKCGFDYASGDIVAFLDADGTCDPLRFADLCTALDEQDADLALGSRMGPGSEMPLVRTIGNKLFAWMLGILSKRVVADTASGMRVIRKSRLPDLYPLPDGLHFTPAMSARVLIEGRLKLVEVPMSYAERVGRSKLSVLRDGVRFLKVILGAAMCFRPARLPMLVAGLLAVLAAVFGFVPVAHYLAAQRVEGWMIYRVVVTSILVSGVVLSLCAAIIAEHISATAYRRRPATTGLTRWLGVALSAGGRWLFVVVFSALAILVAWPGIVQYVTSGMVTMHWSRALLAGLLLLLVAVLAITSFLLNIMKLIRSQYAEILSVPPADAVRPRIAGST